MSKNTEITNIKEYMDELMVQLSKEVEEMMHETAEKKQYLQYTVTQKSLNLRKAG